MALPLSLSLSLPTLPYILRARPLAPSLKGFYGYGGPPLQFYGGYGPHIDKLIGWPIPSL